MQIATITYYNPKEKTYQLADSISTCNDEGEGLKDVIRIKDI